MLILASQSPRRRELLERAGISCSVQPTGVPEERLPDEAPTDYVVRLAKDKAHAAVGELVLGADTVVVVNQEIPEKPRDSADAARMMALLSGREHTVLTGVCLRHGERTLADFAETHVSSARLSPEEIESYVSSGEPMDKAGGYAIQGLASKFIHRIEGDYCNVVGLSVFLVYRMLRSVQAI